MAAPANPWAPSVYAGGEGAAGPTSLQVAELPECSCTGTKYNTVRWGF